VAISGINTSVLGDYQLSIGVITLAFAIIATIIAMLFLVSTTPPSCESELG
jgi:hypothetical protein